MASIKASLPKGVRDFGPKEVRKRRYITDIIRTVFEQFGYLPIETPSMENLSTLTGKYGAEGDKLLFKILNSGDYLSKADEQALAAKDSRALTSSISKKGLRYDLTVPLARFVCMHQNDLAFPFKRYQMQAVWRADRPQKGRYQEFWQCDADVLGSESLLNEVELAQMYHAVFKQLELPVSIRINNRKILLGIAEQMNALDRFTELTIVLDKLDKIGKEGVLKELEASGFSADQIKTFEALILGDQVDLSAISGTETGGKGVEEMRFLLDKLSGLNIDNVVHDLSLARGLDYYTGTIFEVTTDEVQIGSLGGGGRYDDLTAVFGLQNMTGVGISFGLDRIQDVLEELDQFPKEIAVGTTLLLVHFDEKGRDYGFDLVQKLRAAGISAEVYPDKAKLQKQMKYANQKQIPFVSVIGDNEMESGMLGLKNMESGEQQEMDIDAMIQQLSNRS